MGTPIYRTRHRKSATTPNKSTSQAGTGLHGNTGDQFKRGELGTVVHYDSDTYTSRVKVEGSPVLNGVARMRSNPGDIVALPIGTEVLISYDYGAPVIMGILDIPASNNANTVAMSLTDIPGAGGEGLNRSTTAEGNYRGAHEPRDLIPGDQATVGVDGNAVAVLGGGVTMIRSSPVAQVRTHLVDDKVEVISRNYQQRTDMGDFEVKNEDGKVNMRFRGGTDQRSETGAGAEKWTIRLDMGSEGDVFNLEFVTPQGNTLFKFHVDAEGHAEIFGINGINLSSGSRSGGGHTEEHTGDSKSYVGGVRATETVGGVTADTTGNETNNIGGDKVTNVGNDWRTQAFRDVAIGAGRNMHTSVQGPLIPIPGSPAIPFAPQIQNPAGTAVSFDVENGDYFIEIGHALSPPKTGNYVVKTNSGDIVHETLGAGATVQTEALLGNIEQRALSFKASTNALPDSVILGGEIITSHVVKWEELFVYLNALHLALDTHTHLIAGTAFAGTIPVTGTTVQPIIPIGAPLTGMLPTFRSVTTGVTG